MGALCVRAWRPLDGGAIATGGTGVPEEHASGGAQGVRLATERAWDLVVCDIELPEVSGLEVLRRAKEAQPEQPALLMTAHERIDFAITALQLKADGFVLKPLRKDDFLGKVGALLEESAARARDGQRGAGHRGAP